MELARYITICGVIAERKGFDLTRLPEHLLFTATEIGEALEELDRGECSELDGTVAENKMIGLEEDLRNLCREIQKVRQMEETDLNYEIVDEEAFLEELSDILIYVFSYIYGNDFSDEFIDILDKKIEKNSQRERLHGLKM